MFCPKNRREFLKMLAGGAAGLSFINRSAIGAGAQAGSLTATKLTDTITLISGAGSNVLLVNGPEGVLLVDGGSAERASDLVQFVTGQPGAGRIQALFNTHWHLEHTGANDAIGKTGAKIIAHENTKLWMGAEIICGWQKDRVYKPRPKEARPNESFYTTGKMTFGKEEIRYGYLGQAHTDGDIYVFFPNSNILVTGDVFSVGSYPILDWTTGGWIGGLTDATRTLAGLVDDKTRIVPGSGPVRAKTDLQAQLDMVGAMRTRFIDLMRKGMALREWMAAKPTKEFDERWGDPELFITNAYPGLWNHVREIGGIV
jgi:glyoxylase-like metal-dependent hydrolase (beta-lactamase superfamily II)